MSEHFVATTRSKLSGAASRRLDKSIKKVDPTMAFVGPVNIPGNELHGWIVRPNDGKNNYIEQKQLNKKAADLLIQATARK
jgi:hypothetical protein